MSHRSCIQDWQRFCVCVILHDILSVLNAVKIVLDAPAKLGKILIGMNKALGDIPVTVKLRTGVKDGKNTAHKLMPRLTTEWGAGCLTVRKCSATV
jgi:tRNA-dihydrouridine synthase 3